LSKETFYPALHSLRGFAAFWVVIFHVKEATGIDQIKLGMSNFSIDLFVFVSYGYLGVQLFFILSAFLLGLHYFQADPINWSYRSYVIKRIARIYPAYLTQLAILITLGVLFGYDRTLSISDIISHLFLYFNLPPNYLQQLNGVWWTLPVEFGFYIILPILAGLLLHVNWLWLYVVCLVLTLSYRWTIFQQFSNQPNQLIAVIDLLPGELSVFAAGVICAWYTSKYRKLNVPFRIGTIISIMLAWLWVLVHSMFAIEYFSGSWLLYYWESINAVLFAAIIYFLAYFKLENNHWITHPVFLWIGKISYGIYLWHWPILQSLLPIMKNIFESANLFWPTFFSTFCLTIICAVISYYWIEKPGMRFGTSIAEKIRIPA
jgi:peptidoglycan/LPS O-acetylase OafA/YrhL